jgi:hypothetical protein
MKPQPLAPGNQPYLVSFMTIRKGVGLLGVLMPIVLVAGQALIFGEPKLESSMSAYYYTKMGNYMGGTLCAVAFFLYCYRGYEKIDLITSRMAAVFAWGIVFFPGHPPPIYSVLNIDYPSWVATAHFLWAALMFCTFAFISIFLFTRSDTPNAMTRRKRQRNVLYKVCGIVMLVGCLGILLFNVVPSLEPYVREYHATFCFETLALWSFGLSWLTKGQFLLKDKT